MRTAQYQDPLAHREYKVSLVHKAPRVQTALFQVLKVSLAQLARKVLQALCQDPQDPQAATP